MKPINCCGPQQVSVDHKDPVTVRLTTQPEPDKEGKVETRRWVLLHHDTAFQLAIALLAHLDLSQVDEVNEDAAQGVAEVWEEAGLSVGPSPRAAIANAADLLAIYGRLIHSIPEASTRGDSSKSGLCKRDDEGQAESSPDQRSNPSTEATSTIQETGEEKDPEDASKTERKAEQVGGSKDTDMEKATGFQWKEPLEEDDSSDEE